MFRADTLRNGTDFHLTWLKHSIDLQQKTKLKLEIPFRRYTVTNNSETSRKKVTNPILIVTLHVTSVEGE